MYTMLGRLVVFELGIIALAISTRIRAVAFRVNTSSKRILITRIASRANHGIHLSLKRFDENVRR